MEENITIKRQDDIELLINKKNNKTFFKKHINLIKIIIVSSLIILIFKLNKT